MDRSVKDSRWGRRDVVARYLGTGSSVVLVVGVCLVIVAPIVTVVVGSFWSADFIRSAGHLTLHHYATAVTSPGALTDLRDTVIYTLGATAVAMVVGTALAVVVTRTDVPFPRVMRVLPILPLFLPGLLKDVAWIEIYSPQSGLLNYLTTHGLGFHSPLNIFTMTGMVLSDGLTGAALPYLIMLAPLSSMDVSLEEASQASGAGRLQTIRRVTLPVLRPSLISGFALTALLVACEFETPVLIGRPGGVRTYMSQLYASVSSAAAPNYDLASAQAVGYLVFTGIILLWYLRSTRQEGRFAIVTGKGAPTRRARVGRWRWVLFAGVLGYFVVAFLQLVVMTVLTSLVPFYTTTQGNPFKNMGFGNYRQMASTPSILHPVLNSVILSLVVAVATVLVAGLLAFVSLKTRWRGRRLAEVVATLPIGIPPIVFSAALLITLLSVPAVIGLYGSLVPLVVADVVVALPYAIRVLSSALISIHSELLEASAASGAGVLSTIGRIVRPLLAPALISAGLVVFVRTYLQLGAVVFLTTPDFNLLPTTIFSYWGIGNFGLVNALNVISVVVPMALVGVVLLLQRLAAAARRSSRTRQTRPAGLENASLIVPS